jgi:hypothetical protein
VGAMLLSERKRPIYFLDHGFDYNNLDFPALHPEGTWRFCDF